MNTKLLKACFVAGALIVPVVGHSADSDSDRSSPKAFVKDTAITAKVKAEMAKDRQVSALHIKVETDNNGVVTLSGTAKSREEANKAVAIARDVKGVVSVENNIKLATSER